MRETIDFILAFRVTQTILWGVIVKGSKNVVFVLIHQKMFGRGHHIVFGLAISQILPRTVSFGHILEHYILPFFLELIFFWDSAYILNEIFFQFWRRRSFVTIFIFSRHV